MRLLSAIACELDVDVCHFEVEQALFNPNWIKTFFCAYPEDVVAYPVK